MLLRLAVGKKRLEINFALLKAKSSFWLHLLNSRDKKALFTCVVDQDWSDNRLLWLDIVNRPGVAGAVLQTPL